MRRLYRDGALADGRSDTLRLGVSVLVEDRRITWIRHLTRERGVNLAGIRILFELEERLGARILEALYAEGTADAEATDASAEDPTANPHT